MTVATLHRCDAPRCGRMVRPAEVVTVTATIRGLAGVVEVAGEACGARCASALLLAAASRWGGTASPTLAQAAAAMTPGIRS